MSATPRVPAEPQEVPVASDMTAVTRKAERTKNRGLRIWIPAEISAGIVPERTQVPISMPMVSRIRMTGSTAASFSPVERWMSIQVAPRRTAWIPATLAATSSASTNMSASSSKKIPPTRKQATRVIRGRAAAATERGFERISCVAAKLGS